MDTAQWLQLAPPGTSVPARAFATLCGNHTHDVVNIFERAGTRWLRKEIDGQWCFVKEGE